MKDIKLDRLRHNAIPFGQQFLQSDDSAPDRTFGQSLIETVHFHLPPHRERIYAPLETLRLFIGQILSTDGACQEVVGQRLSERIAQGQSASALTTGSYCDARQGLPLSLPVALGRALGTQLESAAPPHWRWQRRTIKIFDGTTVSMPDRPSNQAACPQSREQKAGLGFPIARTGALIGLASGAVIAYQVAACKDKGTGEQ